MYDQQSLDFKTDSVVVFTVAVPEFVILQQSCHFKTGNMCFIVQTVHRFPGSIK